MVAVNSKRATAQKQAVSKDPTASQSAVRLRSSSSVLVACDARLTYRRSQGVDAYVQQVLGATPLQVIEIERQGVPLAFVTDLSRRMGLPASRMFALLSISTATVARKAASGVLVNGLAGLTVLGLITLLGIAQSIVDDSTVAEAETFDVPKWMGQWIDRPQAALGGRTPSFYLSTPTGVQIVAKVLGAMRSGVYL